MESLNFFKRSQGCQCHIDNTYLAMWQLNLKRSEALPHSLLSLLPPITPPSYPSSLTPSLTHSLPHSLHSLLLLFAP
eukprot:scaffold455028_cov20-Prasinocladus_malaysianus.AAC.1